MYANKVWWLIYLFFIELSDCESYNYIYIKCMLYDDMYI